MGSPARTEGSAQGRPPGPGARARVRSRLIRALSNCATEAHLAQVLYAELHPVFGYDSVNLQVLEREGWYHSLAIERGVLQDVRRRLLVESFFAEYYRDPKPQVIVPAAGSMSPLLGPGPGLTRRPRTLLWVPILHRGQAVGAVSYQLLSRRPVPPEELRLLAGVHEQLGVLVSNAYLNELTRDQAVSLSALNEIARALSATRDEDGIVAALQATLGRLIPADAIELAVREDAPPSRLRLLSVGPEGRVRRSSAAASARRLGAVREVLETRTGRLEGMFDGREPYRSAVLAPVVEGGLARGVLAARSRQPDAYELSTVTFLQQVADQVALALRNARSYAAIEAQSRHLKIVDAVGRRLASSLDRWSIMHILREELGRHLDFDVFSLATVTERQEGPVADGYVYDSGEERPLAPVALASAGPSREAYETGRPVLLRRSPWARELERQRREGSERVLGQGVVLDVTRPGRHRRVASRSIIWVPVRHGEEIIALLSLQSYQADAFDTWHVQVLQDVATHVGLALANADHFRAARLERHRLEALHMLEMGVAGATGENQIGEAVVNAIRCYLDAPTLMLLYLDPQGRVTGYWSELGQPLRALPAISVEWTRFYFKRILEQGTTIAEPVPQDLRMPRQLPGWPYWGARLPAHVMLVPLFNGDRTIGALCAQRLENQPFTAEEVELLESAAPVVGIALRTARLHRANEVALAHSVRLQTMAGLAGHDLAAVLDNVAELARTMLEAQGAACWAFDDEGRVAVQAARGGGGPGRVLRWSGRTPARTWRTPPTSPLVEARSRVAWSLVPLWSGGRLVGALGSIHAQRTPSELPAAVGDFAQHAAIAIDNARLAAETRGRIRALEAVADFANLDITRPMRARAEMCRLVERALASSRGAMWLLEGSAMVRWPGGGSAPRIAGVQPDWWGPALTAGRPAWTTRSLRSLLRTGASAESGPAGVAEAGGRGAFAHPVLVDDRLVGMITADASGSSPGETRRLMAVLAGQASLVLGRLRLVAELNQRAEMLNTVLRNSPIGMVLEDEAGRVEYVNPEIERIYGVPPSALAGRPASELLKSVGAVPISDPEAGPDAPLELRLERGGRVVQVRRVPIAGSGERAPRVLTVHEDVTRERAMLEAKDLMLRAIGHEVRSPAAAMRSTIASLLQWGTVIDGDRRHALMLEAYEQSERLLSLVENQLVIARLEAHRFEPNRRATGLARSIEQVLTVLRSRYGDRVDMVGVRVSPDLPDAYCEPTHLDQVLSNLIGNALEYTRGRHVEVTAQSASGWLEVTVSDDGGGLSPERRASLFAKTAPAGQNRAQGGLGLGLYLCRLVVERSFGGRIWLADAGARGATFKFTVPAAAVPARRVARSVR
jgi:signal transduction histidine kinase/GAF domain-containing protein